MVQTADVVVIGGGIIGASVAFHLLARRPELRVVLLEKESVPGLGATSKATGGIRCQFSTRIHVELSRLSLEQYHRFEEETGQSIGFRQHGYLFLTADPGKWQGVTAAIALQNDCDVPTQSISPSEARTLIPGLRTNDLAGASFCPWDGSANPNDALQGFLQRARERGLDVRCGEPVVDFGFERSRLASVRTASAEYACGAAVLAAGAWAKSVAALAGLEVPVEPYGRQVFTFAPHPKLAPGLPLLVDLDTGWYLHQEARGGLLMGGTDRTAKPGISDEVDRDRLPALIQAAVHRLPLVEDARLTGSYAGTRPLTPDDHPILGSVPEVPGLWLAVGFGGHGFMHAPAAGLALTEALLEGESRSLDIRPLALTRFREGRLLHEVSAF